MICQGYKKVEETRMDLIDKVVVVYMFIFGTFYINKNFNCFVG